MPVLRLPTALGALESFALSPPSPFPAHQERPFPRVAYAAAHVVADPLGSGDPWGRAAIDWERTLKFRHRLWDLGLGVAEAMDTAQRGMGLEWGDAKTLISRAIAQARTRPGAMIACGVGTDQLDPGVPHSLGAVTAAYEEQLEFVEAQGGRAILMASRALARAARGPGDYAQVYDRLLSKAQAPLILHWLGDMFDASLGGYWGGAGFEEAMAIVLDIIARHAARVDGIKISLLDAGKEVAMRARLPAGVRMYTGDDFNYAALIAGDGEKYSHALLGVFDPIAPAAAAALARLGEGDRRGYEAILAPTVALSRKIFEAPTPHYKAGVVFMAWLNGFQEHFAMLAGLQSARSILHYAEVFRLADRAGLLEDPERAARRMRALLATMGVEG